MATVEIKGLQRTVNMLRTLGVNVQNVVDSSLQQSAEKIAEQAVKNIQNMNVTYNGHNYDAKDTGALMREIHTEHLGLCRYAAGTDVPYAPYVEFGTGSAGDPAVAHTTRPKWVYFDPRIGGFRTAYPQPPRPFLRPAFVQLKDVVSQNIRAALIRAAMSEVTP